MGQFRCRWVRARLPLLAGHELTGSERRRVERHLIGCLGCRERRAVLTNALDVLHAAAVRSPLKSEAPSLWPALARQIRESRRPAPTPDFGSLPFGGIPPGPVLLGLSLALGLLIAIGLSVSGTGQPRAVVPSSDVASPRPVAPKVLVSSTLPKVPSPKRDLPTRTAESSVVENTPSPHIDYDLEHGTPMPLDGPRDGRDTKSTTY